MTPAQFHQSVEHVWAMIEMQLEEQGCDVDCETQGAVFTLFFNDDSQIVINKQESMQELWLASKLGGYHFSCKSGEWLSSEGRSFWVHLAEAVERHGETVSFNE